MAQILIIEDDLKILNMYKILLGSHGGYHVITATDGASGLKLALEEHPELILLDIMMPNMNGIEVMHKLREDDWGKGASIIILTNLDPNNETLNAIMQEQPTYYLIKSNNSPDQILEKVNEILKPTKVN